MPLIFNQTIEVFTLPCRCCALPGTAWFIQWENHTPWPLAAWLHQTEAPWPLEECHQVTWGRSTSSPCLLEPPLCQSGVLLVRRDLSYWGMMHVCMYTLFSLHIMLHNCMRQECLAAWHLGLKDFWFEKWVFFRNYELYRGWNDIRATRQIVHMSSIVC